MGQFWAWSSVTSSCLTLKIRYSIALKKKKNLQYNWYVNDIIILTNDANEINIQDTFQKNSVLNFTNDLNKNSISLLDVLIETNNNNSFTTYIYRNPTNNSWTLNFKSECPNIKKQLLIT